MAQRGRPQSNTTQAAGGYISNLINGVSQQPPTIRFQNQADECINGMPTIQDQLARRGPLEALFKLTGLAEDILAGQPLGLLLALTDATQPYTHWYRRDTDEAYVLVFTGTTIKAFSIVDGTEKTVNFVGLSTADEYAVSTDPIKDFYCYTYKDTTFVVNRSKTVALASETSGSPYGLLLALTQPDTISLLSDTSIPQGLIIVKNIFTTTNDTLSVTVKVGSATWTASGTGYTGAGNTTAAIVVNIMTALTSGGQTLEAFMTAQGGGSSYYQNVGFVYHPAVEVKITVSDSVAGTIMNSFTDSVPKLSDLPAYAPNEYRVKVTGATTSQNSQDQNTVDDVYYQFYANADASFGAGVWRESIAQGIPYRLDATTLPHQLVREADGTFTFKQIPWEDRTVGDEFNNPDPLFVGEKIHSVFLANGRFGMLAAGNFCTSRTGEANYFNFWKTTILTQLDTDPVVGVIPSSQVNKVYWATQWNGALLVYGDSVDGAVTWTSTFAPNKITIDTPTRFGSSPLVAPVPSGSSLFYPRDRGEFSILYEYRLDPLTGLKKADNLTNYAGSYVPKSIIQVEGLETDFLVMLSAEERFKLFPYNYFYNKNGQLVQQAFHTWEFATLITGIFVDALTSSLYVMYVLNGEYFIGNIVLYNGATDENLPAGKACIDARVTDELTGVTSVYSSGTGNTVITLPWGYGTDVDKVLELRHSFTNTDGDTYPNGYLIPITSQTSDTLTLAGNWEGALWYCGLPFTSYYDPCKPQIFTNNPDGTSGPVADVWKEIQLKRLALTYNNSAGWKIQIINRVSGEIVHTEEMPLSPDDVSMVYDDYKLYSGIHLGSIFFPMEQYKIRLLNDSTRPSYFCGLSWYGEHWNALA